MKKLSILLVILAVLSALILVSCSGEETPESCDNGGGTTVEKVTITFNTDGGDPLESLSIEKGKDATLPTPTRAGYSFDGWYLGNTPWDGKSVGVNTTITAKWTLLEFEIEYIVENGENSGLNVPIYTVNDTFVLGVPTVIGEYYEFFGWYLVLEDGKQPIEKIEAGTTGKLTLYAEIKYQPFELALKDDNTYEVVGLRDLYMTEGKIPAYYKGKAVTSIKEQAFYENTRIEKIAFADTIKTIGYDAFSGCTSLKSVRMSSGIEDIDTGAFYDCPALEYNVYENISYLGNENNPYIALMMSNDRMATACVINENTRLISSQAFAVNALTSVTIPQSVKYLCFGAFGDCYSLSSVTFEGEGLLSIGDYAFTTCAYISEINLPNGLQTIGKGAFLSCTALKKVVIGDGVTAIPQDAFQNCTQLTEVVMGKNVEIIEKAAFSACASLEVIDLGAKIQKIEEDAFISCSKLKTVKVGDQIIYIDQYFNKYTSSIEFNEYNNAFYLGNDEKPYLVLIKVDEASTECEIHPDTRIIYYSAFENSQITSISIPASVRYIYDNAFAGCSALSSITFEDGCTSIGKNAFKSAPVSSITLPKTLEFIGEGAFSECQALTSITLPDSVTEMGAGVFANCRALTSVKLGKNLKAIPEQAFQYCVKLNNVVIPSNVSAIGGFAFDSCTALTSITISEGVTSIGNGAFYSCSKLVSITMPNTLKSIGDSVFCYCERLESVELGSGVSVIGKRAFSHCSKLSFLNGCESVSVIGDYAFEYTDLMAINFTDSLKSIGISAFERCDKLTIAKLGNSLESIGQSAFSGTSIKKITLPASLVTVGNYIFDSNSAIEKINICAQEIPSTWSSNWCTKTDCTINFGYSENN